MITMARNVCYVEIDNATGFVTGRFSVPAGMVPEAPADGRTVVIPADRKIPAGPAKLDRRKLRQPVNRVASISSVETSWRTAELTASQLLEGQRAAVIEKLDRDFAQRASSNTGPLAGIHAEKRRQAEAGGGPLVDGEVDRQAILEKAARQDEALATIERERRAIKAAIRAATTKEEIDRARSRLSGDHKDSFL